MADDLAALPRPEMKWPEPEEGNEVPTPLMDSTRDYEEQLDAYKAYQDRLQTHECAPTLDLASLGFGATPAEPIKRFNRRLA